MSFDKWIVGGPFGPFYNIVSQSGKVIAMRIIDKNIADEIVRLREENAALSMACMGKDPHVFENESELKDEIRLLAADRDALLDIAGQLAQAAKKYLRTRKMYLKVKSTRVSVSSMQRVFRAQDYWYDKLISAINETPQYK